MYCQPSHQLRYVTQAIFKTTDGNKEDDVVKTDKSKGYRISGGIIVIHGKDKSDLQLTTDDKKAFQETMDDFVTEVSEIVDFNKLNLYSNHRPHSPGRI